MDLMDEVNEITLDVHPWRLRLYGRVETDSGNSEPVGVSDDGSVHWRTSCVRLDVESGEYENTETGQCGSVGEGRYFLTNEGLFQDEDPEAD